jgi:capsid protein
MTTFRSRLSNAIGALFAKGPQNSVTGDSASAPATPWGTGITGRGTEPSGMPTRALQDMKPIERKTSIARSRFIANRTGLGRAMIEGSGRYAIGEGLVSYAATGDQEFDDSCNRVLDALFEANEDDTCMDIAGGRNWYEMQEVVAPEMMKDGDCGAAKILRRDLNGRVVDTPKLQLFATDQISDGLTPWAPITPGAKQNWSEGVLRDEFGKALKYRIQLDAAPGYPRSPILGAAMNGNFAEFDARDFMLVLDPKRIGIGRGLPWTHHGQSSAITMMDLKTLEESAAYLNAFFGAVITTPDGEMPEGFEGEIFKRRATKTDEKRTTGTTDTEIMRKYANFMGGALIPVLKEGEKLEMVKSDRPSLTFTGFMDWLVNDIAWGFGIPPSFVWAIAGRTGPETRFTLSQADWFFKFIMRRMISRFCKPTRDFVIRWGLLTGRINNGRPPRNGASPFLCRWHGPRKITIDERYFYKTWLDRLDKGLGTEEEFYADLGLEASDVRRARVLEVKAWLDLCEEHGVPYELVRQSMPGSNPAGVSALDLADAMQQN